MADILRAHGPAYIEKFGDRMPARHRSIMEKVIACRTEALGGEVYLCDPCREYRYSYHSCQDRHCPKCGNDKADEWLTMQSSLLLPVTYFLVTFTVPEELNRLARSNQRFVYGIFFQTAAAALQKLARDPNHVGGQLGFFGVLHTWTRDLAYHPHLHFIVAGGGLANDATQWRPAQGKFLVPVVALSKIFRAKFRDALKKKPDLFAQAPAEVWRKDWVVHCEPVGNGRHALQYLAPYIFRIAISNRRLVNMQAGRVTFNYRDGETKQLKSRTLTAEEFIRRFLQHVLPHRFTKVRYYGFLAARNRHRLQKVKEMLCLLPAQKRPVAATATSATDDKPKVPLMRCRLCGGMMRWIGEVVPTRIRAP